RLLDRPACWRDPDLAWRRTGARLCRDAVYRHPGFHVHGDHADAPAGRRMAAHHAAADRANLRIGPMAFAFKPIELVPPNTKFRFSSYFRPSMAVSLVLAAGTVILLATAGLNFGIDFRGGTMIAVRSADGPADIGS